MKTRKWVVGTMIFMAAIIIICAVLYFLNGKNLLYLEIALLLVGILNVVNGILTLKTQNKGLGVLLICSGIVIIAIMIVAILI